MNSVINDHSLLVLKTIADRMRDPQQVKQTVLHPNNRNPKPFFPMHEDANWGAFHMGGSCPSVLLFFSEIDRIFPEEGWDEVSHQYVLNIKESIECVGDPEYYELGIYGGLAEICYSLHRASRSGTRYQRLLSTLEGIILKGVEEKYLVSLRENLQTGKPSRIGQYDLIQGIVGIGIYCLIKKSNPSFNALAKKILQILVAFSNPIKISEKSVPGWYIPSEYQINEEDKAHFPNGNFNLGLAHGVTGILSFLAVASLNGITVEGQKEAMVSIAEWIQNHRGEKGGEFFWESVISFENEISNLERKRQPCRDAWCYGTPGIARSLYLTGKALHDHHLKLFAVDSFCSVFQRGQKNWDLPGPTFCHGISGLLMITWLMARDSQDDFLHNKVDDLKEKVLEFYSPQHPFGFKDLEPSQGGKFYEVDRVNLLEGVTGILLTLLSVEGLGSCWHASFLIDDEFE